MPPPDNSWGGRVTCKQQGRPKRQLWKMEKWLQGEREIVCSTLLTVKQYKKHGPLKPNFEQKKLCFTTPLLSNRFLFFFKWFQNPSLLSCGFQRTHFQWRGSVIVFFSPLISCWVSLRPLTWWYNHFTYFVRNHFGQCADC